MIRFVPLLFVFACGAPLGPPDASLRVRIDVDRLPDPPEDPSDFTLTFRGTVTSRVFEAQDETLVGFDFPGDGFTMATDDGGFVSVTFEARIDGVSGPERFDLAVDDPVVVTYRQIVPLLAEGAVLVEDADGFVAAAVDGRTIALDPLDGRLQARQGATAAATFNHPCGRGRPVTLDFLGETAGSAAMNEAAAIQVDGAPVVAYNIGSWLYEERPGVTCEDFAAPWRWLAWRVPAGG